MSHEASDLFSVLGGVVSCRKNMAGRAIGGKQILPVGIGETPGEKTIHPHPCKAEQSGQENHSPDVSPGNMGDQAMTYSDPSHQLLHRIAVQLERIADSLEKKSKPKAVPNHDLDLDSPAFQVWWNLYPRKVGKDKAQKAWAKVVKDAQTEQDLISDMRSRSKAWEHTDKKFIPHPTTFLNGKGWMDEIDQAIPDQSAPEPKTDAEWLALAHKKGINTVGLTLPQLKDRIRTA